MMGWLWRALGPTAVERQATAKKPRRTTMAAAARFRRVHAYLTRVREIVQQTGVVRARFLNDLSPVYASIRTTPERVVLECLGAVGGRYAGLFGELRMSAESNEPPAGCEGVQAELLAWLVALEDACGALCEAKQLRDRALLRVFRVRLGDGRARARALQAEIAAQVKVAKRALAVVPKQPRRAVGGGLREAA